MLLNFDKKVYNTDKFRQSAIKYQTSGRYCDFKRDSKEYLDFWLEEQDRCLNGYTAPDGDFITGFNYFYLNYCPIKRVVETKVKQRDGSTKTVTKSTIDFPSFYIHDYRFFNYIQDCQTVQKHACVLKARRRGYSYKSASMLLRNYFFIPNSKGYVFAAQKRFLVGDGTLTKAWQMMSFIDENTAWSKKRQTKDTDMHKRASYLVKDSSGNKIEAGYMSEIMGFTLHGDPDKMRGIEGQLIFFEEGGAFPELMDAWNVGRAAVEQDTYLVGLQIAFGTASVENDDFASLQELFTKPDSNNIHGISNIWDLGCEEQKVGFFHPFYEGLEGYDAEGNRLYMDKDGNTFKDKAIEFITNERQYVITHATSQRNIDAYCMERAITPRDAMLTLSGNIFPKRELEEQLIRIRNNKSLQNHKQVGDLVFNSSGIVEWHQKKNGDITKFPLDVKDDPTGSIVIWEHPVPKAPFGLYVLSCDPYDHDQANTSSSLGSVFVYKRFNTLEDHNDILVAEYTGRPATAEEFYENVRKLTMYYNGKLLYENQNKGLFTYFANKRCDYLLVDQPDILNDIIKASKVQRRKGAHITQQIKNTAIIWLRDKLIEEYAPGKKWLTTILSEPLLEELIRYNDKGNFDRVSSMIVLMILLQEYQRITIKNIEREERKMLFTEPLFTSDYFNGEVNTKSIFDGL